MIGFRLFWSKLKQLFVKNKISFCVCRWWSFVRCGSGWCWPEILWEMVNSVKESKSG